MKLGHNKGKKVTEPDFWKRFSFLLFLTFFRPKIKVFRMLCKNGSKDFAHFAYLDRSHQYLKLFYRHPSAGKNHADPFLSHVRPKNSLKSGFSKTFRLLSHFSLVRVIGSIWYRILWQQKLFRSIYKRPQVLKTSQFWIISIIRCQNMSKIENFWLLNQFLRQDHQFRHIFKVDDFLTVGTVSSVCQVRLRSLKKYQEGMSSGNVGPLKGACFVSVLS